MKVYTVVFTPEAREHLAAIYRYIAVAASPDVAARYTDAIVRHCETFQTFAERGAPRDDVRPGLRITTYRKRVVIAYTVSAREVAIIGAFYGGQDYLAALYEGEDQGF